MLKKLITLVILIGAGIGGYYYWESTKPPKVPEIMKATISQGDIVEVVQATGTLQATRTVPVGSQISGIVESLGADFNDIVRKDQVLAQIDTSILKTQVDIQEANIARQQVDLESQKVQLEDLERNFKRQQDLFASKLVTQQALEAAELQVKSRKAQIASAEKSMVQTQFSVNQAKLNVQYATIKSPIDGVVINRAVDVGQTVQSSQSIATMFTLAMDLTKLKLEGGVDETDIGKVRRGMTVRFRVEAYPNTDFEGIVTMVRLNPTIQQNVVTYTTVAEVPNNDLRLKPGMTASPMRIEVTRKDNVIRLPNAALRFRPTADMYAALGQEQLPTQIQRAGDGKDGKAGAPAAATTPGAPAAAGGGDSKQARGGDSKSGRDAAANPFTAGGRTGGDRTGGDRTGGDRTAGGRQGGGMNTMNLTPEQLKQLEAIRQLPRDQQAAAYAKAGINFGGGRGGGRGGQGGQGGGRGGRGNAGQNAPVVPLAERGTGTIDDQFPAIVRSPTRGQVYILEPADATHKYGKLKRLDIQQGISDGTFTELVSGPAELVVGTELVNNIVMPWIVAARPGAAGNPFSGQPQRGMGMPGGGMPGGGGPGGGGGGGGRGGGGR